MCMYTSVCECMYTCERRGCAKVCICACIHQYVNVCIHVRDVVVRRYLYFCACIIHKKHDCVCTYTREMTGYVCDQNT
jgi:hypothetical protein